MEMILQSTRTYRTLWSANIGIVTICLTNFNNNFSSAIRLLNCYVFSVLKYGCESWTVNKSLMKRIHAFEQWCYLAYAGHILRGSGGRNALVVLEGKIKGKKSKRKTEENVV